MIEELKNNTVYEKAGGAFRLTALIQRRMVELLQGARPLVDTKGLTELEVVIKEIAEDKIRAADRPLVIEENTEDAAG